MLRRCVGRWPVALWGLWLWFVVVDLDGAGMEGNLQELVGDNSGKYYKM
jgi:hypothetical protein